MGRPTWHDAYWKKLDKDQSRRMRSTCPYCGSDKVYFNERFGVWRCGACERSFSVQGAGKSPLRKVWTAIAGYFKRLGGFRD